MTDSRVSIHTRRLIATALALIVFAVPTIGAAEPPAQPESPGVTAPLFEGMGPHKRKITTQSEMAQRFFDQGLTWAFAFNHDEAIRSFAEVARLDPQSAMAHWGIALCNGPHINNPVMDEAHSLAAWSALQKAQALKEKASPVEQLLIDALAARYQDPATGKLPFSPEERQPFDRAYADAMKKVFEAQRQDADIGTLYAESLMNLRPWDLWHHRTKEPRPETLEIVAVLEHVLQLDPKHPGAAHLYVHAMEASATPERALPAADVLRTLVPISGHLVHMPAHIDVRVGRWDLAAEQNRQALKADAVYREISPHQGFYRLYMAHNHQFLSWAAMMEGRAEEAIAAANAMLNAMPEDFVREYAALMDGYTPIDIDALIRFGRWDELLALQEPADFLPIRTAMWRFGRATALAAKGDVEKAQAEQELFRAAVKAIPEGQIMTLNPAHHVMAIAEHTLAGEIAFRRGALDEAIAELSIAVEREDDLLYMEPPDWMQPVRHSLGAVLLEADRVEEAASVYREDLVRWPENGWSLKGLAQALERQDAPEAAAVKARFEKAWARADTEIRTTCLCVTPPE